MNESMKQNINHFVHATHSVRHRFGRLHLHQAQIFGRRRGCDEYGNMRRERVGVVGGVGLLGGVALFGEWVG